MELSYEQILKDLKSKKYAPLYLLHGEEAYHLDKVADYLEHKVLNESEKAFNLTVLYGKDIDYINVLSAAQRLPMMASHQVVIVKEAQRMRDINELAAYAAKPVNSTLLVIVYKHKKLDKRTKLSKAFNKNGVVLESKKVYDNQIPQWMERYLNGKGYKIKQEAIQLLSESLDNNLSKITNELDKLILNTPKDKVIDKGDIQHNIGINKDYNVFELQKALGVREVEKAYQIVNYFGNNPKAAPIPMLLGSLYNYFVKVYMLHYNANKGDADLVRILGVRNYFLKDYRIAARKYSLAQSKKIIQLLHRYDLHSKGIVGNSQTPPGELLKELVFQILHA